MTLGKSIHICIDAAIRLLLAFIFCAAYPCYGADEEALAKVIKEHGGKFISELGGARKDFILQYRPISDPLFNSKYDQESKALVIPYGIQAISNEWIYERCSPFGKFVGQNAFGVKKQVKQLACERLEIYDSDSMSAKFGSLDCDFADDLYRGREQKAKEVCINMNQRRVIIPMSADEYRSLKRTGILYQVEFEAGGGVSDEVYLDERHIFKATIDSPVEKHVRILTARGRIKSLAIITPGTQRILIKFDR